MFTQYSDKPSMLVVLFHKEAGPSHLNLHHRAESEGFTYEVGGSLPELAPVGQTSVESEGAGKPAGRPSLHGNR